MHEDICCVKKSVCVFYRTLIGMNMTSKDNVNFVLDKPGLEHNSHAFSFHVVVIVAVVPGRVNQHNQPWSLGSVNPLKLFLKPIVLRSIFAFRITDRKTQIINPP